MKFPRKFYLHCRFPRQSKKAAPAPLRKHINFQPTPLPPLPSSSFRISIQIPPSKTEGRGERERTEESNLGHKIFSARQKKKLFCGERKRWVLSRGDYRRRRRKSDAFFVASAFPPPLEKRPIAAAKDSEKGGKEEDGFFKARFLHFRLFKRKNFPNGKTKFLTFPSFFRKWPLEFSLM